ncbi:hypothetical protein [Anaeromicropila populeti]|uniref:Uncharacterized protein n=1 Tax=Anaeromicropila populeti TaxID=37658 RepID=A0A1I6KQ23_9FIRM|nr:hypothetical protein [Anaeromicropila populeti]SFR93316.1 hypothetical protein SAMN05661086_02565 [Anaeromicropila populeti]
MKRKVLFACMLLFCAVVLSACGAKVHTETTFQKDGSGKRITFLEIKKKDEGKINGGFSKLKQVLNENAPSCISVSQEESEDGKSEIFELKYDFKSIEDYKEKTELITGKSPDIQWDKLESGFSNSLRYTETISTRDLIEWMIRAVLDTELYTGSEDNLYELAENKVDFEEETVWTGSENPFFTVNSSFQLEKIAVYTTYDKTEEASKKIQLGFAYEDFILINIEKALEVLKRYSENFKVDRSCNGFSVTLNGQEEMKNFFLKASDGITEEELNWNNLNVEFESGVPAYFMDDRKESVFMQQFRVAEVYNFHNFLKEFSLATDKIEDYVLVPEDLEYKIANIKHVYDLTESEYYNYIGAYPVLDTYYMSFLGSESVTFREIEVRYEMDSNLTGTRQVSMTIEKGNRDVHRQEVVDFYGNREDKISCKEEGDILYLSFVKDFKVGTEEGELSFQPSEKKYLHKRQYRFADVFDINSFVELEEVPVKYVVSIPASFQLDNFYVQGEKFGKAGLKNLEQGERYEYELETSSQEEFAVVYLISAANILFYGIVIIILLLLLGTGGTVYFWLKKEKQTEEESGDWR